MSFFGGGDYGAKGYKAARDGAYGTASNDYSTMGRYGRRNMGFYDTVDPMYREQMMEYARNAMRKPTAQDKAAYLNNAEGPGGAASYYARARANLLNQAGQMGVQTAGDAGAMSGAVAGGLSYINNGEAQQRGQNSINYYNQYESPEAQQARLMQSIGALGTLDQQTYQRGMEGISGEAQGYYNLGGAYGDAYNQAQQEAAANDPMNAFMSIAGTASQMYGAGMFGKKKPVPVNGAGAGSTGAPFDPVWNTYKDVLNPAGNIGYSGGKVDYLNNPYFDQLDGGNHNGGPDPVRDLLNGGNGYGNANKSKSPYTFP